MKAPYKIAHLDIFNMPSHPWELFIQTGVTSMHVELFNTLEDALAYCRKEFPEWHPQIDQ